MSERQIYTMAFDMKVPEKGPIQILEFMAGHHAGYKGYTRLNGKDMAKDLILPQLRQAYPEDVVEEIGELSHHSQRRSLHEIGSRYGFGLAIKGSGILYPHQPIGANSYSYMSRTDLQFVKLYPKITVINSDQQMLQVEYNKAAQNFVVQEDKMLSRLYVPSLVMPTRYETEMADQIKTHFNHDGFYVFKPADEAQGNGVRIVPVDDLDETLKFMLGKNRKGQIPKSGRDYWRSDINPVFLVQPYIESRAIVHDGKLYDGTLRVFATMHRDAKDQPWAVIVHDGYWKLPRNPLLDGNRQELGQMVSHSPHRQESRSVLRRIFSRHAMQSHEMTQSLRDEVFPQVQEFCTRLPEVVGRKTLHERIWEHLSSDDRVRQGTGALMAAQATYYVGNETDQLPLSVREYPETYIERLKYLCLKDDFGNVASNYISGLMNQSSCRDYAYPLDTLIKDPDFIGDMKHREEMEKFSTITGALMVMMEMNLKL